MDTSGPASRVIDGDGHLLEDLEDIAERMPPGFVPRNSRSVFRDVFPPRDHLHSSQPLKMLEGSFAHVGPDGWLEFADKVGIERAALYPTWGLSYGLWTNADWAMAACRAYNDWVHDTYQRRSDRFIGMGIVPVQEPSAAAEELRRIVQELGMSGAVLPATGLPTPLGSPTYWPVFEEANRLGCALSFHGGVHTRMGLDHFESYPAVNALGHPFGQMITFTSLLTNGVFDRCPNVRFAFLEGGIAWLLLVLERFERAWATHVPIDPRGLGLQLRVDESPTEHICSLAQSKRLFVGCEGDEPYALTLINSLGANPILFSSDFPHETTSERCREEIDEINERQDIAPAERRAILVDNATILYGLHAV